MVQQLSTHKQGEAIATTVTNKPDPENLTLEQQVERDEAENKKELARQLKIEQDKRIATQSNVSTEQEGVQNVGADFFDNMFREYYKCQVPGYDALFSDERFPMREGRPMVVSRCYHYKVDGKYLLFDIFEPEEIALEEIIKAKAVFNKLGFLYTWVFTGEKIDLIEVFENRLKAETPKVFLPRQKQTNVEFLKTT